MKLKHYTLVGIDLAWVSANNPTAIAVGSLRGKTLTLDAVLQNLYGIESILEHLAGIDSLHGVTIDGPTIIRNFNGRRACEDELSRVYGSRKAGCHTSNLSRYPNADSVKLGDALAARGFVHLGNHAKCWQSECYPHPALIEIFQLRERHLYKKGGVEQKRQGQKALAQLLLRLESSPVLRLRIPGELKFVFSREAITALRGKALKHNEDALDAVICLYIAGLYQLGHQARIFGDAASGYIYVPQGGCLP